MALGLRHLLISRGNCWAISLTLLGSKQFSKVSGRSHLLGLEAGAGERGGGGGGGGACDALVPVASNGAVLDEKCPCHLLFIQRHLGLARTFVQDVGLKTKLLKHPGKVFARLSAHGETDDLQAH